MISQKLLHPWNLEGREACLLQSKLSSQIIMEDCFSEVNLVAGVDVAYDERSNRLFAAVVVLNVATCEVIETASFEDKASFPYIPGLFSFRELPPLTKALEQLSTTPDLIICDGQGLAHPRRFGLACHLGLLYDIPTIGCSKTRLLGEFSSLGRQRGSFAPLVANEGVIGHVLRTQDDIKPVYVSVGHRISLPTSCGWVLRLASRYRLPETTRLADQTVRTLMRKSYR